MEEKLQREFKNKQFEDDQSCNQKDQRSGNQKDQRSCGQKDQRNCNQKDQKSCNQKDQKIQVFRSKISQHFSNKIKEKNSSISICKKKQSTHQSIFNNSKMLNEELVLVYLMYKKQKISIFLQRGTPLKHLMKMLYKQIYLYQKQTYSISNSIIKDMMMKISGFQTLDNDLTFNYCLKNGIGNLQTQKFITPLLSDNMNFPLKIYSKIHQSQIGIEYICRNYHNGQYYILTSIKKKNMQDQNKNKMIKQLKYLSNHNNFIQGIFHKMNYFQTEKHFFLIRQNQALNLKQYIQFQQSFTENQIFSVLYSILLILGKLNQAKIYFKKLNLTDFSFDDKGCLKASAQILLTNLNAQKRMSQKDFFTFFNDLSDKMMKGKQTSSNQLFSNFLIYLQKNSLQQKTSNFNQCILQDWIQKKIQQRNINSQKFEILLSQTLKKRIFQEINKKLQHFEQEQNLNQIKQEIRVFYNQTNLRIKQYSKEVIDLTNNFLFHSHHQTLLAKQTIKNFQQLHKQMSKQEEHMHLNKSVINEVINQFNKNEKYISQIKKNNIASIKFYLQKSQKQKQKRMLTQIKEKYKKYLQSQLKQDLLFKQKFSQSFLQKDKENQTFRDDSAKKQQKKTGLSYFSSKSKTTQTKRIGQPLKKSKIRQLFVDERSNFKREKNKLKKKQYEIYLLQAQKQYNKIKVYKNHTNINC